MKQEMKPSTFQIYSDKLEKILCKYMDKVEEGSHLDGYEMADLIREVSGNEIDARFVELYLKYVETGKGGKILKWDMTSPYNEERKEMKKIKEGSENNPRFKMMEGEQDTLKEIEKMYGVKVANMLQKYCTMKDISPSKVVDDTSVDRNGMCAWDKFDVWARSKGVDFAAGFGDVDIDELLDAGNGKPGKKVRGHAPRVYDRPDPSDIYAEGSGSDPVDEYFIHNWIGEELQDCDWAVDVDYGESPILVTTQSGKSFKITVEPDD